MGRLQAVTAVVVTCVWALVWLVAIYRNNYDGAVALTPIMLVLVGFLFGREAVRGLAKKGSERDD